MTKNYNILTWDEFSIQFSELSNISKSIKKDIFLYLENSIAPSLWTKFEMIKHYNDLELFRKLAKIEYFKQGDNIIISDVSFDEGNGPFCINSEGAEKFIDSHKERFRLRLFCGLDLAIINVSERFIFIYHHEGYYINIKLSDIT